MKGKTNSGEREKKEVPNCGKAVMIYVHRLTITSGRPSRRSICMPITWFGFVVVFASVCHFVVVFVVSVVIIVVAVVLSYPH